MEHRNSAASMEELIEKPVVSVLETADVFDAFFIFQIPALNWKVRGVETWPFLENCEVPVSRAPNQF